MNPKHFIVLFFSAAAFVCVNGIFNPVVTGLAVNIPLLSVGTGGTLALPLAVLGAIKLAAAAALAGVNVAAILQNSAQATVQAEADAVSSLNPFRYRQRRHATPAPSQDALFTLIKSMDLYSCGKSLICELEAKNPAYLFEDEKLMLSLFTKTNEGYKASSNSAKAEYVYAAELGLVTKSQVACRKQYASCPYTADEMMAALRAANI